MQSYFALWRDYKRVHDKVYETFEEEQRRFTYFMDNHEKVTQHNADGTKSYSLKLNKYADMEHKEFVQTMNGFKRNLRDPTVEESRSVFLAPANVLVPPSVDWRTEGYVTPVKDQKHCGSCWSFSATGALEGQHFRKSKVLTSLSEQNLVDCSSKYGNQGCNGGLMDNAFKYIKENKGIDTEAAYPYEAKDGKCRYKKDKVGAQDVGFQDILAGNETDLMIALATVGPVSVAIDASHTSFQFYHEGVYDEPQCDPESLDHGVLAVGYGVEEDGSEFWIVKNSWGLTWGLNGYIKMTRNKKNQCGIASAASYPLV
jgi:cathepsin L